MFSRKLFAPGGRLLVCAAAWIFLGLASGSQAQQSTGHRPRHALRRAHALALRSTAPAQNGIQANAAAIDPPEQTIGERLFLETRFAQYFASHFNGNVNQPLAQGDPTVNFVQTTTTDKLLGPFAGKSMNCRSCHFVDELGDDLGNRTYADFTRRSPIPDRQDGHTTAPRNALNMVDSSISRPVGLLLHGDGEFASLPALVDSTITGRNFGWLPSEYNQAIAHLGKIIRQDDGTTDLDRDYGGFSYAKIFLGTAPDIPAEFRLPPSYRIDVTSSSDEQIADVVERLISAYVFSLTFSRDANGIHDGSPYDKFLTKNNLPFVPAANESEAAYSQRLLQAVNQLPDPKYVTVGDGAFETHDQKYVFGPLELQGLTVFLRRSQDLTVLHPQKSSFFLMAATFPALGFVFLGWVGARKRRHGLLGVAILGVVCCGLVACGETGTSTQIPIIQANHIGNCAACHAAPNFTDFQLHNTGASQEEYDAVHGDGAFAQLAIPSYAERQQHVNDYLPATPAHPLASGRFRAPASASNPSLADLGLWNVYANTDFPEPQPQLEAVMCGSSSSCDPNQILPLTIGRFKTPTLRDLGHSQPYLHTGRMDTIEKVMDFYRHTAILAQAGQLRNADPAIAGISIDGNDAAALSAFLRALNEDYD